MKKYLNYSLIPSFCILLSILLCLAYSQQKFIVVPHINNISGDENIKAHIFEVYYRYSWIVIIIPIVAQFLRISITALCLYIGSFFYNYKIRYISFWNIALKSYIVIIFYNIIICVTSVLCGIEKVEYVSRYTSFALLVDPNITPQWIVTPIMAFNVFEICFCLFMTKLFSLYKKMNYMKSFAFIMSTYGIGYLLYVLLKMLILTHFS